MSSGGDDNLSYALEGVLFPTLIIFVVGWLIGATHILPPPAVFALNMTVLYFILPCAVFSGFLTYRLTGSDLFFLVPNIIDKILSFFPAFIPFFIGKINLRMACTLWLTGVYANALSYGNYFLYVYYTGPMIPTFCSLASVPDNVLFFPVVVFLLEYSDYKKQLAESATTGKVPDTTGWKIFLSVVWRVVKNPIVWACFSGIILNQAVLAPGGKFPTWIARFFTLGAQCTLPISMFLLGVFTATYDPIHKNVMRFFCCVVSPLKSLCAKDGAVADNTNSESVKATPSTSNLLKAEEGRGGAAGADASNSKLGIGSEPAAEAAEAAEAAVDTPLGGGAEPPQKEQELKDAEKGKEKEKETPKEKPKDAAEAVNSSDYKFNWILTIVECIIRHLLSPALMLVLCLMFGSSLSALQKHALILIMSLGTPGVVFSVSRLYNAYPGEAAITQVIGSFILTLPSFLLFLAISRAVFPL